MIGRPLLAILVALGGLAFSEARGQNAPSAVISNQWVRVELDPAQGQPRRIEDLARGIRYDPVDVSFTVELPRPAPAGWVPKEDFTLESFKAEDRAFTSVYRPKDQALQGLRVTCRMELAADGALRFSAEAENRGPTPVLTIRYPVLNNLRLEGQGTEGLFIPLFTGYFIRDPRKEPKLDWVCQHPNNSMGWVDYFSPKAGVMVMPRNPGRLIHEIAAKTVGQGSAATLCLWGGLKDSVLPGETQSFGVDVFLHDGGWRPAADYYRTYVQATFGPVADAHPAWARAANGYYGVSYQKGHLPSYEQETQGLLMDAWHLGMRHIQIWGQTGVHACPAYYWPMPTRGGEPGFTRMVQALRKEDMHVGAYFLATSVSAFHAQSDRWPGVDDASQAPADVRPPDWEWLLRNRHVGGWQDAAPRRFTTFELRNLLENGKCDSTHFNVSFHAPEFRQYLNFWIDRYITRYGIDVPYLDVFGLRPKHPEFNPHLDLYGDASAANLQRRFLEDLEKRNQRPKADGIHILMEGALDTYIDRAGGLISNFSRALEPSGYQPTVAYRHIYPDALLYEGHNNGLWNYPQNVTSVAHAFLNGNRFDLLASFAFHDHARALVWLREALVGYLQGGQFLPVEADQAELPPGIESRLFRHPHSALMTFYNPERKAGTNVRLLEPLARDFARAGWLAPGEEPRVVERLDAPLALPAACASALVLVRREAVAAPPVAGCLPTQLPGGGTRFRLFAFNPGGTAHRLSWTMRNLEKGTKEKLDQEVALAPGAVWTRTVEQTPAERYRRERVLFTAQWKDGAGEMRRTVEPFCQDPGTLEVAAIHSTDLHLAPRNRYVLRCEVWREKGAVAQIGVHDRFTQTFAFMSSTRDQKQFGEWEPFEKPFETADQGWLRLYFYNRGEGPEKGVVRYRKVAIDPDPSPEAAAAPAR